MAHGTRERRSLRYIRLAAFLARQPTRVDRLVMSVGEIEDVVGEGLPTMSRYPSWWRNDERRVHSRAWLTAGWQVDQVVGADDPRSGKIVFVRLPGSSEDGVE